MSDLFWFSDTQWSSIQPLLPTNTRGMPPVDDRRVLSGIVHVLKSGCRWSDCPKEYDPHKTIYNRFIRRVKRGNWEDIFAALARAEGAPDTLMIDSTIVKAHRCSGGGKKGGARAHAIGRSKGGRTTKIHAVTDDKWRPCVLLLAPGNTSDHKAAHACLGAINTWLQTKATTVLPCAAPVV